MSDDELLLRLQTDDQIDALSDAMLAHLHKPGISINVGVSAVLAAYLTLVIKTSMGSQPFTLQQRLGTLALAADKIRDMAAYIQELRARVATMGMDAVTEYQQELLATLKRKEQ